MGKLNVPFRFRQGRDFLIFLVNNRIPALNMSRLRDDVPRLPLFRGQEIRKVAIRTLVKVSILRSLSKTKEDVQNESSRQWE